VNFEKTIDLDISGFGLIFYSPFAAADIGEGEDYLESCFGNPSEVEKQALEGRIVGVSTSSPGLFLLSIQSGYPPNDLLSAYQYKLRLGVEVRNEILCIRDLFDLMSWSAECPAGQTVMLENGFYHITLLSNTPESEVLGDEQEILVYLQKLGEMPKLRFNGVPTLC
jgi:hypothetical protein